MYWVNKSIKLFMILYNKRFRNIYILNSIYLIICLIIPYVHVENVLLEMFAMSLSSNLHVIFQSKE